MVNSKKIRWIPILMTISQIMLTGFVAYWLRSQFRAEKEFLNEELTRIYDESRSQVMDSLLFNWVVEPAMKDSVTITMMTDSSSDTTIEVRHQAVGAGNLYRYEPKRENTVVAIALQDSSGEMADNPGRALAIHNKKQDLLIRSVKLFINHSGDTASGPGSSPGFVVRELDTGLFKRVYTEKIDLRNLGITVVWSHDTLRKNNEIRHLKINKGGAGVVSSNMHFTSTLPDNLPVVQVKNDFPYLLKKILPQVLFGFILLLLTGSAFYLTNRSLKRQVILNSLRNDFISNITHELRTPVSTVKVALEALKTFDKVSNPAVTRDYLDMAGQELNRLDQLISKVLDQSLIGEEKQVVQPQSVDLIQLIETVILCLQPRIQARGARVVFNPEELRESVMVDPLHFQGVLINLIDNSLKYGPEHPVITVRLWQEDGFICIEVSDNGPGIPKEYLNRVFDKFFRVPTGDIHTIKGYGLGLSFAALVMKQHRGSVSVRNIDPEGCAFTLRFPRHTP